MKRFKKKATAWLIAAVGLILALIAWGIYKAVVVIYGPPSVEDNRMIPDVYGPPPPDYVVKKDSATSMIQRSHNPYMQDSLQNKQKKLRDARKNNNARACVYGPPPSKVSDKGNDKSQQLKPNEQKKQSQNLQKGNDTIVTKD